MKINKLNVVAGVIKKNDLYFVAKRNRNKHLGLKWEFPGGKVKKDEKQEDALKREIKEELGIDVIILKKIALKVYNDHKINIILHYYLCEFRYGEIKLYEHEDSEWLKKEEIFKYDMVEGDMSILEYLE